MWMKFFPAIPIFQSTLPAWGATEMEGVFYGKRRISIHAPRMGSDFLKRLRKALSYQFQSTLPAWGATGRSAREVLLTIISIHAPRMGSDIMKKTIFGVFDRISIHAPRMGSDRSEKSPKLGVRDFNPRSPHGERQQKHEISSLFL